MDFEDDPLQAALATAFSESTVPPPRHATSTSSSMSQASRATPAADPAPPSSSEEVLEEGDEPWKRDYDQLMNVWRTESSIAREKAERERERWAAIREKEEAEEREKAGRLGKTKESEWETVERIRRAQERKPDPPQDKGEDSGQRLSIAREAAAGIHDAPPRHASPSPADGRDLVSGETPRGHSSNSPESLLPRPDPSASEYTGDQHGQGGVSASATTPPSNPDTQGSRTWEEVPSLESSFPSLSYPERSGAPSPEPRERPPQPPSVTLAIFDSSLSTRTRVLALVSSLAINLFLPFVNGVMLGFGEIFAKNVVSALGWKLPGMELGIRAGRRRKQN